MQTPWRDIDRLQLAARPAIRPAVARPVAGWIIRLELQPWTTLPESHAADALHGALVAVHSDACVVDHALCGSLTIPWPHIRRLRPEYHGQLLTLEGRPQHLGNEVKSAFQAIVPQGIRMTRTFDLVQVPVGTAFVAICAADLEPAGKGTREHPWLKRLRAGELTSELWINERRTSVLNQAVTGRGTTRQPQRLRIKLPADALQPGGNHLEIRLQPSRSEPVEYDDWELHELLLEIETPAERD